MTGRAVDAVSDHLTPCGRFLMLGKCSVVTVGKMATAAFGCLRCLKQHTHQLAWHLHISYVHAAFLTSMPALLARLSECGSCTTESCIMPYRDMGRIRIAQCHSTVCS